jgi:hypothetical protein
MWYGNVATDMKYTLSWSALIRGDKLDTAGASGDMWASIHVRTSLVTYCTIHVVHTRHSRRTGTCHASDRTTERNREEILEIQTKGQLQRDSPLFRAVAASGGNQGKETNLFG